MPERLRIWLLPLFLLAACSSAQLAAPHKIALLASFEGRERARAYELLASANLALQDAAREDIVLLAVDSGSSVADAVSRVQALRSDPLVHMVLLAGEYASAGQTLAALDDLPVLLISEGSVGFVRDGELILRAVSPPSAAFIQRFRESNPATREPGLWAAAGYEAATTAVAVAGAQDRAKVAQSLAAHFQDMSSSP